MAKLSWEYDNSEGHEIAWHNGYRISAVLDDHAENPFEAWDGNWPISVYYDRGWKSYDKIKAGWSLDSVLRRFTDEQLVHDQIAIAKILGTTIREISIEYQDLGDDDEPSNYIRDADVLRDAFERELENKIDGEKSSAGDVWAELYELLGIPCLSATSTGYHQGDYAYVLVVATPEAHKEFGCDYTPLTGVQDAHVAAWWEKRLQGTVDLYSAWAWGDVYGYVIEHAVYDEDGEIEDWVEVEHGSCWGYYGSDHAESGLEDAALECVPDKPAPGAPEAVRLSDNMLERV